MRPRIFGIWAVLGKVWRQSLYGICQWRDGSDPILKVLPSSKAKNGRNSSKVNIISVVKRLKEVHEGGMTYSGSAHASPIVRFAQLLGDHLQVVKLMTRRSTLPTQ